MRSKSVSLVAVFLAAALIAVAAGCGGGGSKSSANTEAAATTTEATTTEAAATTEESATTTEAMTTSESSSGTSFKSTKNCRDLATIGAKLSSALQSSNSANFEDTIEAEKKAFNQLADAAPHEIRGDFQTFAKAFDAYVDVIKKVGFKPGKVPTQKQIAELTKASQQFSSAKLQAAEQHLSAWAQKNCAGIVPTTTGG